MHIFNWSLYLYSFYAIGLFAIAGWILTLMIDRVSHIHTMWSLFLLLAGFSVALLNYQATPRILLVLGLLSIWSMRLSIFIAWRNADQEERRYMRFRIYHEPYFWLKSSYLVFGTQAVLAWVVSLSIYGALDGETSFNALDYLGLTLVLLGLYWEIVADWQLSRFNADSTNAHHVLNTGLWRYSRHPNYFGECCIWWGFYLFALAAGAWWAIPSPLLMTFLLLKVNRRQMENSIVERRPAYLAYIKNTNPLVPGLPKDV